MRYNGHYLRRSFHTIHLVGAVQSVVADGRTPIIAYASHSSWWDLLLGLYANDAFFKWDSYTVMDARQLARYPFLRRVGVLGVDRTTLRGAREFISEATSLLTGHSRALWIAPQGEMISNSARPLRFQPGLAHLVEALGECYCLPVAFDYEFWGDKSPEAFVAYGEPERVTTAGGFDRRTFLRDCEEKLAHRIDSLAALRMKRDPSLFRTILAGEEGISPIYDAMRSLSARVRGGHFNASHSAVPTPPYRPPSREDVSGE